jgi:hypothetical protein
MEHSLLAYACIICGAAWLLRTVFTASGRYPVLISYLAYYAISPVIFWIARPLGLRMEYTLVSNVLAVALAVATLLEIHNIVMERYVGFRKLGGILMQVTIWASGVAVVALTFLVPPENLRGWSRLIPFQAANTHWALALVAISMAVFFFYFELKPSRNIRVYLATFTFWFLTIASTHTVVYQLGPESRDIVLPLRASVYIVLTVTGAIFFSKAGEHVPAFEPIGIAAERDARAALENMNEALLRVFKDQAD